MRREPHSILVTGGSGFIGANFIRYMLKNSSCEILNYDLLSYAGCLENLSDINNSPRYSFVRGDICDKQALCALLRQKRVDTVINFAAETHVDRSIKDPAPFFESNVRGVFVLLEAIRECWTEHTQDKLFLQVSTDEVFGALAEEGCFSEQSCYAPRSPYAATKASADHMVRAYHTTYGLPTIVSNCSNNYGPYQFPEKFIPLLLLNALEGNALPIYGDGKQVRDWLYVDDHCSALHAIVERGIVGESYLIGSGCETTNIELAQLICSVLAEQTGKVGHDYAKLLQYVADRPGHDRRYAIDSRKIRTDLGWQPNYSLVEGLAETVSWYLANPVWLQSVRGEQYQAWLRTQYEDGEAWCAE